MVAEAARPHGAGDRQVAHKKAGGSSRNGRDSNSQRLGVKRFAGQDVRAGTLIVGGKPRDPEHRAEWVVLVDGTKVHPGRFVGMGRDHTLYALVDGTVKFDHATKLRKRANVVPVEAAS